MDANTYLERIAELETQIDDLEFEIREKEEIIEQLLDYIIELEGQLKEERNEK